MSLAESLLLAEFTGYYLFFLVLVRAPWNTRLLKTTEDSLTIGWDKMTEVDYYVITYFPTGNETSVKQVRVPKTEVTYEILRLLPGTKYIIALRNVRKTISSDPELLQGSTGRGIKILFSCPMY